MSDRVQEYDHHVRSHNIARVFKEAEGWTKNDIRDPDKVEDAIRVLEENGQARARTVLEAIIQLG